MIEVDRGARYDAARQRIAALVGGDVAPGTRVPATPGWSVHDVVAHLAGVARDALTGNMEAAPGDAWTAAQVARSVGVPIAELLDVVEPDDLLARAHRYVVELAEVASPGSLRDTKAMVYAHLGLGYPDALRDANEVQWAAVARPDATEGAMSLLERRPPQFSRLGSEAAP